MIVPGGVDRSGVRRVIPCLLWLIERLARDHDLHVFSLLQDPWPCRYPLLGATVHNAGTRPRRLRTLAAVMGEHRREPFDVLHALWAVQPGVVAAAAGRILGRPVLLHVTGGDLTWLPEVAYGALRGRRGRLWVRMALGGAARVTTPSRPMQRELDRLGVSADLVPLGVALDRWPPAAPRNGSRAGPARLLWVGTLNQVKDPWTLLGAAMHLHRQGLYFRLEVVGEDCLGGAVQARASELGLSHLIRFRGFVPHPDLRRHVAEADLLLVTSRHEADPVVALEAAVAGVPVVGTRVGHLAAWAPEGAAVVPVGDAEGLAREVLDLLRDGDRRREMAHVSGRWARQRDADWTARRVAELYREVARGRA